MNAIYTPNYTASSHHVNSIYESEAETLSKLESLYSGQDIESSMSKALVRGGNALEDLERQINDELNRLLIDASLEEDEQARCNAEAFQAMLIDDECEATDIDFEKLLNSGKRHVIKECDKFKLKDEQHTKHLSNLSNYDFNKTSGVKIKAVIDFIDVQFTTKRDYDRSDLKGALTKAIGHSHFVKQVSDREFTIRLHDIKNKKDLLKRLKLLSHFSETNDPLDFNITCVERAVDFYASEFDDESLASLALAVLKSSRIPSDSSVRLYRCKGETFELNNSNKDAPFSHKEFIYHLKQGYNVGINDDRSDDLYYHIYIKKTDTIDGKFTELPHDQWRVRCELRAQSIALLSESNEAVTVKDLHKVLRHMNSITKFVTPKGGMPYINTVFDNFPRVWGKERSTAFNAKRHRQPQLKRSVVALQAFNRVIASKQEDLARKFTI